MHWRRKWQPTPVFLPGEYQGQGSLVGCHLWVAQSRTRLKRLSSSTSWFQNLNETKTIRGLSNNSISDYCSYSCYCLYHFHLLLASDISTCSCRNVCPLLELLEPDLPPVTKKVIDLFTKPLKFLSALYPILALSAADTLTVHMVKDG